MVASLPALGLPPDALRSLRSAFAREVAVRLPRLLTVVRGTDDPTELALRKPDATMLAEGCTLLGDAAAARALRRLGSLLVVDGARDDRLEAASQAALLLGRWTDAQAQQG